MAKRAVKVVTIDPEFLLNAYCSGYFPMANDKSGEISWYSPDPRAVFDLNQFIVPRSLKLTLKKNPFDIVVDSRFEDVMRACAERTETWISEEIIRSYVELYRQGFAHSVECWKEGRLVGGLYGVAIRGAFFGESMFSRTKDASKVALVFLVDRMRERGFELLDTQFMTAHLARFGAMEISRSEYLARLQNSLKKNCAFI
jgi:leucyl/phenylalanyl-tRNA---protein transferase